MRAPLLVLLVYALATAPLAMVPTSDARAPAKAEAKQEDAGTRESGTQDPKPDGKKRHLPAKTSWSELNPGHQPVPGPSLDDEDQGAERPELPPALYARRLAAAPLPDAPPDDPPRADVRAGHLTLPPPVA